MGTIACTRLEVGAEPLQGYRLRERRGEGGYAQVWEATSPNGTAVALKFINAKIHDAFKEVRSIQTIGKLKHPNLIDIHQTWSLPGYIVVGMELGEGSLLDLLDACEQEFGTPIPLEALIEYMEQAALGIDFLNARQHRLESWAVGYQHCDIKPSNLMLVNGVVKLADFGLATAMTTQSTRSSRHGTLAYAAPEMFQGLLSERSDQFGLAVTYFQLRTGRMPFHEMPTRFDSRFSYGKPDLRALTPAERSVIGQALSPHMADRFANCSEMVRLLKQRMATPDIGSYTSISSTTVRHADGGTDSASGS